MLNILNEVFFIASSILLYRFLPVFGTVDTGKGWQVCLRAIGGITTCHKMRHNLALPTVTYISMREHPHFHCGPTSSFLHSQPNQTPPSGPGLICAAGYKCSFGMIPLSYHSVDRSPRAFHSSTHNVVWASRLEVLLLSSQESCFWMEACDWQGVGHGVDVSGHLLGGSDLDCWQPFGVCWVAFKQPLIILHTYHSERYQHVQYVWNGPTKNRQIQLSTSMMY